MHVSLNKMEHNIKEHKKKLYNYPIKDNYPSICTEYVAAWILHYTMTMTVHTGAFNISI